MQVTITLSDMLILLFCGFLLAILLYVLQLFKNFLKELSVTTAKISRYQGHITNIEGQMECIAENIQCIKESAAKRH